MPALHCQWRTPWWWPWWCCRQRPAAIGVQSGLLSHSEVETPCQNVMYSDDSTVCMIGGGMGGVADSVQQPHLQAGRL